MIRFLNEPPLDATKPFPRPTSDDLERRRRFLKETAGAWADKDGENLADAIAIMFDAAQDANESDNLP